MGPPTARLSSPFLLLLAVPAAVGFGGLNYIKGQNPSGVVPILEQPGRGGGDTDITVVLELYN